MSSVRTWHGGDLSLVRSWVASTKDSALASVACEHGLEAHIPGTITVQQGLEGKLWQFSNSGLVPAYQPALLLCDFDRRKVPRM